MDGIPDLFDEMEKEIEDDIRVQEDAVREIEIENEQPTMPKGFSKLHVPSKEEFAKHCLTHIPYRSWCPICVQSKKRNPSHARIKQGRGVPVFSIDYMFLNGDEYLSYPVVVMTESESGGIWSIPVMRKGNYSEYVSKRLSNIIEKVGYAKCVIKCDQEPAMIDVAKEIKTKMWDEVKEFASNIQTNTGKVEMSEETTMQIILENSPVGESQSNGRVEGAIGRVKGQIRALKLDIETNYGYTLMNKHPIWPWLIEYAGQTLHMFGNTREDGLTPVQRIRGRISMAPRVRLGEKVLYKSMKTVKVENDTQSTWNYGIWLGTIEHTSEHIIGTRDGTVKCRAISPLPGDKCFDGEFFDSIKGTPWRPSPRFKSWKIKTSLDGEGDAEPTADDFKVKVDLQEDPETARRVAAESRDLIMGSAGVTKSFSITQTDISRYSATPSCDGCRFVTGKLSYQRGHSAACRLRILRLMREDPEDKHRVEKWDREHNLGNGGEQEEEEKIMKELEKSLGVSRDFNPDATAASRPSSGSRSATTSMDVDAGDVAAKKRRDTPTPKFARDDHPSKFARDDHPSKYARVVSPTQAGSSSSGVPGGGASHWQETASGS